MLLSKRRLVLLILLIPVLIGLGWYFNYRVSNSNAVARLEAKARQRGEPLTLVELAATYPSISDDENAAVPLLELWQKEDPDYWQAFLSGQPGNLPDRRARDLDPNLPILGARSRPVSRTNALEPAALAAAEAYLKEQAAHLQTVRDALQRPRARFPIQIANGFNALLPHLSALKSEAQQFRLEALVATERGQVDQAITALTNAARAGNLLATEPLLISQLVRLACWNITLEGAQHLLSRRALTEPQLARLENLFQQLQSTGLVHFVLTAERASSLSVYKLKAKELSNPVVSGDGSDNVSPTEYRTGIKLMTALGLAGADQRLMLETFEEAVALADQDTPEALRRYDALFEEMAAKARRMPPKIFCGLLLPSLQKVPARFAAFEGRRRAALAAFAVERHRLAHKGDLPVQLEALVPSHIPSVPLDPFDGEPLRFRRRNPGYVIYSIGADRVDDDGTERLGPGRSRGAGFDDTFSVER